MGLGFFIAAAIAASGHPAVGASDVAAAFGARPFAEQVSLSPDGKLIAVVEPNGPRGSALYVMALDAGAQAKPILGVPGGAQQFTGCHWSTDTRLVCGLYIIGGKRDDTLGFLRLISLNSDGSDRRMMSLPTTARSLGRAQNGGEVIDWLADGKPGAVLVEQSYVPETTIGTNIAHTGEGLGVTRIDTSTLEHSTVEQPDPDASEFITDGHGTVRIRAAIPETVGGYNGDTVRYFYRRQGNRTWLPLSTTVEQGGKISGFTPLAVDPDLDVAYGLDEQDGRTALTTVSLDGNLTKKVVFSRPDVDIDDIVQIGRQRRVVGVSYVTDKRHTAFFDPQLRALSNSLAKALPGEPLITFVDASADENTLLLFASGDTDPGQYYVFDKRRHQLSPLFPARPLLKGIPLAPVKPITFAAADGTQIPGYLTLPPGSSGKGLPAIVMPHGGPAARDEWGFDWLAQFFANRGYAVLQPNFRGSSGYGDAWFKKNGFQSWRTAIGDVDDSGRWLIGQGIADPRKLAILGWSYGGYAALQGAVLSPGLFKAIVAIAPVTDLEMLKNESRDFVNYLNVSDFIGSGPGLQDASPAENADKIKVPVLMFHGDLDSNVGIEESELMEKRLKAAGDQAQLVEYPGLDHNLDDSDVRADMLDKADAFLRTSMGM